ncbi:MAG: hypothetical protein HY683_04945 [Chloroflexi bacterium]|nr:hypothetical protein [Chloroflexota bacterium]
MPTATAAKDLLPQGTRNPADYGYIAGYIARPPRSHMEGGTPTQVHIQQYIVAASQAFWPVTVDADSLLKELSSLGVSCVNPGAVRDYLAHYSDLPLLVGQMTRQVHQALQDMRLSLELVYDPEDTNTETLVLYLHPTELDPSLFKHLRAWNHTVAEQMISSEAWFIVNFDLRP